MFTQEEFDSAYEIVSGFNNVRRQINDDPKLLTKLFDLYKSNGLDVEDYSDVNEYFNTHARGAVLGCYFSLGYPHEYNSNVFNHFDLLSQVFLYDENNLDYTEYENIWYSSSYAQRREYYEKIFNIYRKYAEDNLILHILYNDLLKIDECIAENVLILIKKLVLQLNGSQYATPDGKRWGKKLVYDELELKPNWKPEYTIKDDESIELTIEPEFFDLIDKITSDFDFFVRNELLGSATISHYLISHEPYNSKIKKVNNKKFVIDTLVIKDLSKIFIKLGHSINIDTLEGKILFLYQLKQVNIRPNFDTFNDHCYSFSLNSEIIKVRVLTNDVIKQAYDLDLNFGELGANDFHIKRILDKADKELSKKYMVILYRFASVVAKADGKITEEEENWLGQLLSMTESEKDKDQPDSRISQGGTNPIEELESLIGLASVKKDVVSLANFIKMKKMREEKGLKAPNISYHCVFSGNPGTGKTTVVRILANIFKELGILQSGHLVETDRSGLVAEYVGQTAVKTNKIIDSALDGVLFVDEAYTLVGGQNDYGKEAIATLLKRMEDDRDRLIVILAGYSKEMEDFINSNPGRRSRFNRYILFPDYTPSELFDIFQLNATKNEYAISVDANQYLKKKLDIVVQNKQKDFGNARYIRNYFELAIEHQANRLASELNLTPEKLCELTIDDIDINT